MSKSVFECGTRISIFKFDPKEIKISPELNGRAELPDIEALIHDIVVRGQLEPVRVRKDGDKPCLVSGFSRWQAISEINKRKLTEVPLSILATYMQGNERDGFLANISENRFRNSTTSLDDATNIQRLLAWQMDEAAIAKIYFPAMNGDGAELKENVGWVRRTAKLANLTPEAKKAVKEGRIKPSAAAHIAELAAEAQRELVKGEGKIKGKDVAKASGKPGRMGYADFRKMLTDAADSLMTPTGKRIPNDVADWLLSICE